MNGLDWLVVSVLVLLLTIDVAVDWFRSRRRWRRNVAAARHEHAALMREVRRQP